MSIKKARLMHEQTECLFCFWSRGNFAMEELDSFLPWLCHQRGAAAIPSQLSPIQWYLDFSLQDIALVRGSEGKMLKL